MPRPLSSLFLASLPALLALGCLAPAPPEAVTTSVGVVRAKTHETAVRYALMLEELYPIVQEALPGALDRPAEVWIQDVLRRYVDEEHRSEAMGFTILSRDLDPGRIHLRDRTAYPEWYLSHELGHALMGPSWKTLPGVLTEGICDWLSAQTLPDLAPVIRTHRLLHLSLFFGGMSYEVDYTHPDSGEERRAQVWYEYTGAAVQKAPEEVLALDRWSFHTQEEVPVSQYGLGFLIVDRIASRHGLEKLHSLCVRASAEGLKVVPTAWILEAAEIDPSQSWVAAARSLLGEEEFYEIARMLPSLFRELSTRTFIDRFGELDADAFLSEVNPRLSLYDGSVIPLASLAHVRAQVRATWPPQGR